MKMIKRLIAVLFSFLLITAILLAVDRLYKEIMFPIKYYDSVSLYCQEYGVDEDFALSVINTESKFKFDAVSKRGAMGLMQLMPATALWIADELKIDEFKVSDLYIPETNIRMGIYYLSYLNKKFDKPDLTAAAYNAGETKVKTWLLNEEYSQDQKTLKDIPYSETKNYVKKVMYGKSIYKTRLKEVHGTA